VSRKLWCAVLALGLVLAACASKQPNVQTIQTKFLPQRVDALDDVGRGVSLALDKTGNPHMSYLGLIPVLAPGEIPPARAATAPALPAVLVSSVAKGQFQHGDVVQTDITAAGQPALPLSASNQTAIAVGDDGTQQVVWTQFHGLFYATAPPGDDTFGEPQTVADVFAASPSIALDANGKPVVAFVEQADSGGGVTLQVATLGGGKKPTWSVKQVADLGTCQQDCPLFSAQLRNGPEGPVVAYADVQGGVSLAEESGGKWSTRPVQANVGATGVSLAIGEDGSKHVAYATSDGKVQYASTRGPVDTFHISTVATYRPPPPPTEAPPTSPSPSPSASASASPSGSPSASPSASASPAEKARIVPSTAVGVDRKGGVFVAWADPETRELDLASRTGGTFQRIQTAQTDAGEFPSMAVTPGGHVQVAWYNADAQDLMLGSYPERLGAFAVPVPSTPAPQGGGSGGPALKCPKGTVEILAEVGAGGAGFKTPKVTAPSGNFDVCFNNEDNTTAHNVEIFKSQADATPGATPLAGDQPFQGPKLSTFKVSGLSPGDYYFHCVVHPTTMTGTLTVK
jgi:plastocyanin